MSCGTRDCGCGCDELVELSPPVTNEGMDCGDGSCGCGCGDLATLKSPKEKGQEEEKQRTEHEENLSQEKTE